MTGLVSERIPTDVLVERARRAQRRITDLLDWGDHANPTWKLILANQALADRLAELPALEAERERVEALVAGLRVINGRLPSDDPKRVVDVYRNIANDLLERWSRSDV